MSPNAAQARIDGTIDAHADASAERIIEGMRSAFGSPGGNLVQVE
jgi:hypothetical protein